MGRWGSVLVLLGMFWGGCGLHAQKAADVPRTYECRYTGRGIRVDGRMDDAAWRRAAWTSDFVDFVDIEGAGRPKPRFRTRVKMLWDERYLYIGAEMEEPDVHGTLTEHDSVIFHDDDFEVFLKPRPETESYFEFEMNALNTGWDLYLERPYKMGGRADNSWEIPGLRTAVWVRGTLNDARDRDRGWTVEIAYPMAAFGSRQAVERPREGTVWRLNFSRVEWPSDPRPAGVKEDNWVWSPQGLVDMHVPERWG